MKFEMPAIEVEVFNVVDVITTSTETETTLPDNWLPFG